MSSAPRVTRRVSPADQFRGEIAKAEESGVSREDMTLQLSLNDVSHLKRDRTLAVTDISFADGAMTFLGVKVVQGGGAVSVLTYPGKA
jgi:hypothetical protein